jgi:hypothetical protein
VLYATYHPRFQVDPSYFRSTCHPRISTSPPYYQMTTSACSSTFSPRRSHTLTRARSSLRQRARCAMRSHRRAIFMHITFQLSWRFYHAQAWPSRYYFRSSILRITLVGYHSQTSIRVSRAMMERSLTSTREPCQLMPKVF